MGKVKKGTGVTRHSIDYDNKTISIDLSGNYNGDCFRNDASIFFFAANSYLQSYSLISRTLKDCFENKSNDRIIERLIMPYFFNFRHYVELELKALWITITDEYPAKTHDIRKLHSKLNEGMNRITYKSGRGCLLDDFNSSQKILERENKRLSESIDQFSRMEPASDYYRYLFKIDQKKYMLLENALLFVDYNATDTLFHTITNQFRIICSSLTEMGVYVYNII